MYHYRTAAANVYGLERAAEMMLWLNAQYDEPYKEELILQLTGSVDNYHEKASRGEDKIRHYPIQYVAAVLTGDMRGLDPYYVKPQRDRTEYQHNYYTNRLKQYGLTSKASKIEQRRNQIREYLSQNMSANEIAALLNVCVRTVRNDIKAIKEEHGVFAGQAAELHSNETESSVEKISTQYKLNSCIFDAPQGMPSVANNNASVYEKKLTDDILFNACHETIIKCEENGNSWIHKKDFLEESMHYLKIRGYNPDAKAIIRFICKSDLFYMNKNYFGFLYKMTNI